MEQFEFIDIGPDTSMIESIRQTPHTWDVIAGELIDNAITASATRIEFHFVKERSIKTLIVSDNGIGIPSEKLSQVLIYGKHLPHKAARSGKGRVSRYGVGLKDSAIWLADQISIKTVFNRERSQAAANWKHLNDHPELGWKIRKPLVEEAPDAGPGTELHFLALLRNKPSFDWLADRLGLLFMPALRDGVQIDLISERGQHLLCKPYSLPPLERSIEEEFSIDGKTVKMKMGIVKEGQPNRYHGFLLLHDFRFIQHNTRLGAGEYNTSRIAGTLDLDHNWYLAKNKNQLTDPLEEQLDVAIFLRCESLLKLASQQAINVELEGFMSRLNDRMGALNEFMKAKERRDPGQREGRIDPVGGHRRNPKNKHQPGEKSIRLPSRGGFKIFPGEWDDGRLGLAQLKPLGVTINTKHPAIERYVKDDNFDATLSVALSLLAYEQHLQGHFAYDAKTAVEALAFMLSKYQPPESHTKAHYSMTDGYLSPEH